MKNCNQGTDDNNLSDSACETEIDDVEFVSSTESLLSESYIVLSERSRMTKEIMSGEQLDDSVINFVLNLLQEKYPWIGSLQSTLLGPVLQLKPVKVPWVQILHCGNHWVTVSAVAGSVDSVDVYDSLFNSRNQKVIEHIAVQVAQLVKFSGAAMKLRYRVLQEQKGYDDCGLFAIARAVAICNNEKMLGEIFIQDEMRGHLVKCIEACVIEPFPTRPVRVKESVTEIKIDIYCICRLPHSKSSYPDLSGMVRCDKCKKWYHNYCLKIESTNVSSYFQCFLCII